MPVPPIADGGLAALVRLSSVLDVGRLRGGINQDFQPVAGSRPPGQIDFKGGKHSFLVMYHFIGKLYPEAIVHSFADEINTLILPDLRDLQPGHIGPVHILHPEIILPIVAVCIISPIVCFCPIQLHRTGYGSGNPIFRFLVSRFLKANLPVQMYPTQVYPTLISFLPYHIISNGKIYSHFTLWAH
jgi:hypothetical protein